MIKPLSLFLLCALTFPAHAQSSLPGPPQIISSPIPTTMPYGQIDIADLQMKQCDFEPDANAEILFDQGIMGINGAKSMKRHVRIKIFNDFGKSYGTVRLRYRTEFLGGKDYSNIEAETINLDGTK